MNNLAQRMILFILFPLFILFAIGICATSFFYSSNLRDASGILTDTVFDQFGKAAQNDVGAATVEAKLRKDGLSFIHEPAHDRTLKLSHITTGGPAFDGSPTYHVFYKNTWHSARLMAYFSGSELRLNGVCADGNAGCKYIPALPKNAPQPSPQPQSPSVPELAGDADFLKNAGFAPVSDEKPWKRPSETLRPGIEPAIAVNKSPSEKTIGGQQVLLKQGISAPKERPLHVSIPAPVAEKPDPVDELRIPENIRPWLGKWSGDAMSLTIGFIGGKLRVGKFEAKLQGPEIVFLKENEFGRPIWVKLNFSDGLLLAKEESQFGEVVKSAILKR